MKQTERKADILRRTGYVPTLTETPASLCAIANALNNLAAATLLAAEIQARAIMIAADKSNYFPVVSEIE
jgi:hypothetical protein